MSQQDEAQRFYRESGPEMRRHIIDQLTDQLLEHAHLDPYGLYRLLLADDTLLGTEEQHMVGLAFLQMRALLGVPEEEIRGVMAEILGERVGRYAYDRKTGLFRDTHSPDGRYLTAAERELEMLTALKDRAAAERAYDGLDPVPDQLPASFGALVDPQLAEAPSSIPARTVAQRVAPPSRRVG